MEATKYYGIDASNDISLLGYGLLVSIEEHEDGSGTHHCVYGIESDGEEYTRFDTGHISEQEVNDLINGNDWMSEDDVNSFLSTCGQSKEEWMQNTLAGKIHDLLQYYGYENIFGVAYSSITKEEAEKMYL